MANGWAPIIGFIVTVIFCGAAWFLAPKGENQTYVHSISSSKPTPTKACLRTKPSLEQIHIVSENRLASRGRRVHFTGDGDSEQPSPPMSKKRT
ncbi:hypothetical protein G6011_10421 [Alternaria panax]|uniref:Uncharacterized protein n=1 Tax=Alternaria panax TaxID=48097 RepID=A0AAD4IBY7_9PLEO|nr:hypothetical protein G6011_10421 [Alternaria panax]